jgi:queuine tRNA-ribosyltransferase
MEVMKSAGGLHKFMDWQGVVLTDSGGFQVFSLSKIRKILPGGVEFRSHLDGSKHLLTPKKVLEIQRIIGSDICMILDVCPHSTASHDEVAEAVKMTTKWAKMAWKVIKTLEHENIKASEQLYFAIIQGGIYKDLRLKSLAELKSMDFDGYAIGGLAVGETNTQMYEVLDYLAPELPPDKPRYLMGVGTPENIVQAVKRGVDMFDCVIPTREARHGRLYVNLSQSFKYETINITNSKFKNDFTSINKTNLKQYSKAYLHHLFKTGEPVGMRLATLNNLEFYLRLMDKIRNDIKNNKF